MVDLPYKHAVDEKIQAAIRSAVAEKSYYSDFANNTEREWCAEMVTKYDIVIMLLVAVQAAGEKIFNTQ